MRLWSGFPQGASPIELSPVVIAPLAFAVGLGITAALAATLGLLRLETIQRYEAHLAAASADGAPSR